MSREGALLIVVAIAIVAIGLMAWGWWRRTRRDAALTAPHDTLPADATFAAYNGLYVATTAHDQPLERLAIRGLGLALEGGDPGRRGRRRAGDARAGHHRAVRRAPGRCRPGHRRHRPRGRT
ncbi:hypothetical protein [Microbacterium elymi]|uniref:Uncharacterized protein n=1 Tax=Microbacterium elymi TaxID=2909587 RepID=A0ABY5NJR0_9MICO|nr:hypothetical protein [Microbacterium elymi]UUT35405.1 hypothetical protein L2X98_18490 [Microbacterium elymi]